MNINSNTDDLKSFINYAEDRIFQLCHCSTHRGMALNCFEAKNPWCIVETEAFYNLDMLYKVQDIFQDVDVPVGALEVLINMRTIYLAYFRFCMEDAATGWQVMCNRDWLLEIVFESNIENLCRPERLELIDWASNDATTDDNDDIDIKYFDESKSKSTGSPKRVHEDDDDNDNDDIQMAKWMRTD